MREKKPVIVDISNLSDGEALTGGSLGLVGQPLSLIIKSRVSLEKSLPIQTNMKLSSDLQSSACTYRHMDSVFRHFPYSPGCKVTWS